MLRMVTMAIACFAVAVVGAMTLGGRVARAQWNTSLGDQFFHVEWAATPGPAGQADLTGYVYNDDSYFGARVPASQAYRMQVASFEFVETSGGG